jgi:hypothetical protein
MRGSAAPPGAREHRIRCGFNETDIKIVDHASEMGKCTPSHWSTRHQQSRFQREILAVMPLRLTSCVECRAPRRHLVPIWVDNSSAAPSINVAVAEPDDVAIGVNVSPFAFAVILVHRFHDVQVPAYSE